MAFGANFCGNCGIQLDNVLTGIVIMWKIETPPKYRTVCRTCAPVVEEEDGWLPLAEAKVPVGAVEE